MKLNAKQISELLQINKETLRLYRNQNLINPKRNLVNDYFEYDENDLYTLMFIRRLRGHDVPLKNIYNLFNHEDDLVQEDFFDEEIAKNIKQQEELKKKLNGLIACREHFAMCNDNIGVVKEMHFNDTKYDIEINEETLNLNIKSREWIKQIELLTVSLSIDKKYLEQCFDNIPYSLSLSLYEKQRKDFNLPHIGSEKIFSKGLYLTSIVKVTLKNSLDYELIKPLVEYANERGMTILSGTTAFLIKIDYSKDSPVYYFRIRVKVEK